MGNWLFILALIFYISGNGYSVTNVIKSDGYYKFIINSTNDISRLKSAGALVIVKESNFVIVKIKGSFPKNKFNLTHPEEKDFVKRLAKIGIVPNRKNEILALMSDIWEINDKYVVGQVYDYQLESLLSNGFEVLILPKGEKK